jgi:Domain of unknown function (DUF4907)
MKSNNIIFIVLAGIASLVSCKTDKTESEAPVAQPTTTYNPYSKSEITLEIYRVDSIDNHGIRGWGYNVLVDGKIYIHQPTVPAVMGNNGFSSEEKARRAGAFVINKIQNNIIPPSVTPEELDSLEVLD